MNSAEKLAILIDLLKRKEIHKCDECDHEHEVELGILEAEEVRQLLEKK